MKNSAQSEAPARCKNWPRRPRKVQSSGTHVQVLREGAGLQHLLVQPGIVVPPEQDVLPHSGKLDPRLLCGQTESLLQVTHIHTPALSASTPEVGGWKGNTGELSADQNDL